MDRIARRCRGSVLTLALALLTGCVSPSPDNATDTQQHKSPNLCSGHAECAVAGGAMLLLSVIVSPPKAVSAEDKKHNARSISGRCELMIGGLKKPCQGVLLTLKGPGYSRKAWISDNDFEVTGIKAAKFDVEAYSDEYKAATVLKDVLVGSQIKIQLLVPAK